MRVALHLLIFLTCLLDGHHLPLPPFLADIEVVGHRNSGDNRQDRSENLDPDLLEIEQDHDRIGSHHGVEPVALGPADQDHDHAHEDDLDQALAEIDQRIWREQPFGTANR